MFKKIAVALVAVAMVAGLAVESQAGIFGRRARANRNAVVVNVNGARNVNRANVVVNVNGNRGVRNFNGVQVRVNRGLFGPFNVSGSKFVTDAFGNLFIVDAFGNTVHVGSNRSNFGVRVFNFNVGH